MGDGWFYRPREVVDAAVRLVCLPFAGAAAAAYREWARLPDWIEVVSVQLPARGWRIQEPPLIGIRTMATRIAEEIRTLGDRPLALFGHSMGAWLSLEVTRKLVRDGIEPLRLFVSGRQAPSLGNFDPPFAHLSDSEFVREIQHRYGGIPSEILRNPDVLQLLLPALRADVRSLELYEHRSNQAVPLPIVAYGGDSDPIVSPEDLTPWSEETSVSFDTVVFSGGHFYFQDDPSPLMDDLARRLEEAVGVSISETAEA